MKPLLLACLFAGPISAVANQVVDTTNPAPRKPNILFVITDDQRYDAMSVVQTEQRENARFPWVTSPNMDRLAREGVRFRNAFVTNSVCSPSRATILTGRYNHHNGIVNNSTPFNPSDGTYVHLLRDAGYTTGYAGKWHMGKQSGQRPGFDYSASYIGQGTYFDEPFEVNGEMRATRGWVDDVATDFALDFIRAQKDRTFALTVGYKSPHGPSLPPPRHADAYARQQSRTVPSLGLPPIFGGGDNSNPQLTPPGWKGERLDYFRTLLGVDENLGRILGELDSLGIADDSFVVFTSDNGLFMGEHRLADKRAAYDESLRVPMLVRYPRMAQKGQVRDEIVLNIDLASTFLDYAGVPIPAKMQGRSWRPLLDGRGGPWREAFFYSYYLERQYPRVPTVTAVRTMSAKLVKYPLHPEWTELFDLRADPYETRNLHGDPLASELQAIMERLLERESAAVGFFIPDFADKAPPRRDAANQSSPGPGAAR